MLAGGTATLPGLKDRVTDLTGFASMVVNPFDGMKLGSAVRESKLRARRRPTSPPAAWRCGGSCSDPDQPAAPPRGAAQAAQAGVLCRPGRGGGPGCWWSACGTASLQQMIAGPAGAQQLPAEPRSPSSRPDQGHRHAARRDRQPEGAPEGGGRPAADRNVPVHLLNELVKQTPEGIYLSSIKQTGQHGAPSTGGADQRARVGVPAQRAEQFTLARPQARTGRDQGGDAAAPPGSREQRRLFEFSMRVSRSSSRAPPRRRLRVRSGSAAKPA
jgi:hypothetical protein